MAAECVCQIAIGEVHDGLCLRCRRPTDRRPTAAFISSSATAPALPDEEPSRGKMSRNELLREFEEAKFEARRRALEIETKIRTKRH